MYTGSWQFLALSVNPSLRLLPGKQRLKLESVRRAHTSTEPKNNSYSRKNSH